MTEKKDKQQKRHTGKTLTQKFINTEDRPRKRAHRIRLFKILLEIIWKKSGG